MSLRFARFHSLLALLGSAFLVTACASPSEPPPPEPIRPTIGAIETRDHLHFTLPNGLDVLVVSDPETDKAAAALAVGVGSFDEPDDRLGIAHFLEHMLFLGTEKYPNPDEYGEYISRYGGSRNAYTALDHTNYFFSISADQLQGGLDRFAQFFVAPLFTAEYVEREMNAVNSEYQLQLRDDGWRTYMTQKNSLNPDHPGSRFTIGSLDTLADRDDAPIREDLLAFYDVWYSADNMALVILGQEDVATLSDWAREMFAAVPRRAPVPAQTDAPMFRASDLPSLMTMQPVKERRVLDFTFPLPPLGPVYETGAGAYLANLLGHEGTGSLHAHLKQLGWITSLSAGADRFGENNAAMTVAMELTEDGYVHWQEAGALVFSWIEQIREAGIAPQRHDEQAALARLAFDYREKGEAYGYVRSLASNMLEYPAVDVVRGPFAMDRFDEQLIRDMIDGMTPDRVQVSLIAPDVETSTVEPWFGVPYALGALPDAVRDAWSDPPEVPQLRLPEPNPFVPRNLALTESAAEVPARLDDQGPIQLWHQPDPGFGAPRVQLRMRLGTDVAADSARNATLARLYADLIDDALNEYSYPARLAGLSWSIGPSTGGLMLSFGGFGDSLEVLLSEVLSSLRATQLDEARFEHFRSERLRALRNQRQDRPYQQAMAELGRLLQSPSYPLEALESETRSVTFEELLAWRDRALANPDVLTLAHGNVDATRASEWGARIADVLQIDPDAVQGDVRHASVVRLRNDEVVQRQVPSEHSDSAVTIYIQGRDQSWEERARFGLLAHMISTPYFNALRTEQQLGYVVGAGPWIRSSTPGLFFVVQSPVASPAAVEQATHEFVFAFADRLAALTPEEFEEERSGFLARLLEDDKTLGARTARLWGELSTGYTTFDTRQRAAEAARAIELDAFRDFYAAFLELGGQRRASTWSAGAFEGDIAPEGIAVDDTEAFKDARDQLDDETARRNDNTSAATGAR